MGAASGSKMALSAPGKAKSIGDFPGPGAMRVVQIVARVESKRPLLFHLWGTM
jgi:hypothetical protein